MKLPLSLAAALGALTLVACAAPPSGPAAPQPKAAPVAAAPEALAASGSAAREPPAACLALLDRLSQGIPVAETGPSLRTKGLRIRTPIVVPEGALSDTSVHSGARVRVLIDAKGKPIPGSVSVQQASGDPKLPLAMTEAVQSSLSFDVSGAFTVPKEFAFTTVYAVCART